MHQCPRRAEVPSLSRLPENDTWQPRAGYGPAGACSFCGSMHPADFLDAVRAGREIGPTDKSYKAYLDAPWAKFYFQHLSAEQQDEFVALHNDKTMKIGYPGHFYVRPFFAVPAGG